MNYKGFTIIELMIVVAIVGVLSAIAIPAYQYYIARSQITAAVAELNGAKPQYELIMNGASASGGGAFTVSNMFFSGTQSHLCIYDVNPPDASNVSNEALVCELKNVTAVLVGEFVYLNRDANGIWKCSTSVGVDIRYKPLGCD
ncbi:pilin [Acinetobacter sp. HC8-3S]